MTASGAEADRRDEVPQALLDEVEAGLVDDRRALFTKMPFIGSVLMRLELEARPGLACGTVSTDGATVSFEPSFYKGLKPGERLFALAHEAWHCALLHFARTGSRDPRLAHIAQDLEIHFVLMDELAAHGMEEPFVLPHDPAWKGLSFEEIYERLLEEDRLNGPDGQDGGDGQDDGDGQDGQDGQDGAGKSAGRSAGRSGRRKPRGGCWDEGRESDGLKRRGDEGFDGRCEPGSGEAEVSNAEMRRRVEGMREAIAQAAIATERRQGSVPAHLKAVVDRVVKPQLDWRALLRRYVTSAYGGSRRWLPPSRRHVWQGLYLQSMREEKLRACVAVDTSGSCVGDLPRFFSELTSLLASFGRYEITVIQCDAEVGKVETFTSDRPLPRDYRWEATGGGGTSFVPPFDYMKAHRLHPDVFVYVTDGYGDAPPKPPPFPVLWVLTPDSTDRFAPWGQKIRMDDRP